MVSWGPIDTTPYPGEPGGVPADITGDPSGGLDDPGCVLPESAVQLTEANGDHVAWLADAEAWSYRRAKGDPGSGNVTLKRSDPLIDDLVFPRQLRFYYRGTIRQRALLGPRTDTTVSQQEESGQSVTMEGPGPLALTTRGRVDPLRLGLKPKQNAVSFTFAHPDYDDTITGWESAVDVGDFERPTDWPGGGTNIWGPSGDHDFAPGGSVYIRDDGTFTLASEADVAVVWSVDNTGDVYDNGFKLDELDLFDANNFNRTHERRYRLDAGTHRIAAHAFNQSTDDPEPPPDGNPGSIRITVREIDEDGQLGDILYASSTDWIVYEFPQSEPRPPRPGWTAGAIIIWLLDRWEARGGPTIARSFDETDDSDSNPWPIIVDFTAPVGPLYDALRSLSEIHCDLDWNPETDEIHAYVKDSHGTTTTDEFPTGYTADPAPCILELSHTAEPPLLTSALVEWRDGYVIVEDTGADVPVERKIDAPLVDSATAAEVIGANAIEVFGVERVRGSCKLLPRNDAQRPGIGFDVGDTRNLPDRTLTPVPQVIQSYTHAVVDGVIRWGLEFGDQMYDQEERFSHWLAAISNGTLGGRSFQATPYRQDVLPAAAVRTRDPLVFHHRVTDPTGESDPFPIDDYQTIQAVTVHAPGGEGCTVDLNLNGSLLDSFSVSAAVTTPVTEAGLAYKLAPGDYLTVDSDDAIAMVVAIRVV